MLRDAFPLLTGTLNGDVFGLSTATLFSELPKPEILLLLGDLSEETSAKREREREG